TAYAALVGGMLTLIATPPNLVASQALEGAGRAPFGFFAFTPFGLGMLAVSVAFMATLGRRLLPARAPAAPGAEARGDVPRESLTAVAERFGLPTSLARVVLPPGSPLVGRRLKELRWPERLGVQVLAVDTEPAAAAGGARSRRHLGRSKRIGPDTTLAAHDRLLLQGSPEALATVAARAGTEAEPVDGEELAEGVVPANLGFAEVLLPPRSSWIGKSLA